MPHPSTALRWCDRLSLTLDIDGALEIRHEDRRIRLASHGLSILNAFSEPRTLDDAIARLGSATSAAEWMQLTATLDDLVHAGVLRPADSSESGSPTIESSGWAAPGSHIAMLNDRVRTRAFIDVIHATVRPDDVVLDIGTGTGILTLAACQAGARHVYALEQSVTAHLASKVIEANGFASRATVIRGWSQRLELPERATVLVTETIGSDPFDEDVLLTTWDARRRLLTPNARMIPSGVRLYGLPVLVPTDEIARHRYTEPAVKSWESTYGVVLAPLLAVPTMCRFRVPPVTAREWPSLSDPVNVGDVELGSSAAPGEYRGDGVAQVSGEVNAILLFWELRLIEGVVLSTSPRTAAKECHWTCPVWLLPETRRLGEGERFSITYRPDHEPEEVAFDLVAKG